MSLSMKQSKAELDPMRRVANITILVNDEAYGLIEFLKDNYIAHENDHNTTIHIPVARKRGRHGEVRVYYR